MPYKVIIADSSFSVQKAIQLAFPESEFELHPFENGLDVTKALGKISPDAVLLSLSLPGMDGYETAAFLRNLDAFRQTALIFLRGVFEPLDLERISALDHDGIVQKPFDSGKLARMVLEIIDRKKDPQTFPEEPLFDEILSVESLPSPSGGDEQTSSVPDEPGRAGPDSAPDLEEKMQSLLRREILEVERELEKRLRTRLLADVREWLEKEFGDFVKKKQG